MQPTDVVGQFLDAIAANDDLLDFWKMPNVRPIESQLIEIQVDFFQTVEFRNPSWDMTYFIAFQIEGIQLFAATDARWNSGQITIRQIQTLNAVVLWNTDFSNNAVFQFKKRLVTRDRYGKSRRLSRTGKQHATYC